MAIWAGIDEAGYGPLLGPLVVAGTAFRTGEVPTEGALWDQLSVAISRNFAHADGRLIVNDSKVVYSRRKGLRALEEGVLGFLSVRHPRLSNCGKLFSAIFHPSVSPTDRSPWWEGIEKLILPRKANISSIDSKAAPLKISLQKESLAFLGIRAITVLPSEYNKIVSHTRNKANLLWQKCGLLLQRLWRFANKESVFVLVDRHGGRVHYRKLLCDAFPECQIDVVQEGPAGSSYEISHNQDQMHVAFKKNGDQRALPVALASMTAKYVRELYMIVFNRYWQKELPDLKPTAGYARDARRFLADIKPLLENSEIDRRSLIREQ
ncbi:MAG: hypothetical protein ACLFWL_02085 [Candidatus Brocadiia bacterium]